MPVGAVKALVTAALAAAMPAAAEPVSPADFAAELAFADVPEVPLLLHALTSSAQPIDAAMPAWTGRRLRLALLRPFGRDCVMGTSSR
jgi:hypothetical protein